MSGYRILKKAVDKVDDAEVVEVEPVVIQEIPGETPEEEVGNQ